MTDLRVAPAASPGGTDHERRGFVLVVLAALLWGTMGTSVALTLEHSSMDALDISWLRLVTGGATLLAIATATGRWQQVRYDLDTARHIATNGVLAAIFTGTYFAAVQHIGVAVATVLSLGCGPLVVILHGAVSARRRPPARDMAAVGVAGIGLILVCDVTNEVTLAGSSFVGAVLAAISGCAFGWTAVVNRRRIPGLPPVVLVGTSFVLGGLLLALGMAVAGMEFVVDADPVGWGSFAFVVLGPTAIGYLLFHVGLQTGVPSMTASLVTLLEAVTSTFLAVVVLAEHLTLSVATGSLLVGAAVAVGNRRAGAVPQHQETNLHAACEH